METRIPDILSAENYSALMAWIASPQAVKPSFADSFMTTVNAVYMQRNGTTYKEKINNHIASRMSLSAMFDEIENEKTTKAITPAEPCEPNPILEEMEHATESLPEPRESQLGDDRLPLADENGFTEAQADPMEVAGAVAWHWSQLEVALTRNKPVTMTFLQITLYVIYGTVLAERGKRLFAEHPQMWKYGPVFARVYSQISKRGLNPGRESAQRIKESDPSLAEFIGRIVRIHAGKTITSITDLHTSKSSPWGKCLTANPDKWSTPLDDKDIEAWFRRTIDNSKKR